jgi:hypothetical protein
MLQVFYELTPNVYTEMQTVRYRGFQVGTSAAVGQASTGKIPFDDPGGTLDIKGWRKVRVYETEATPTLLWSGRIRNKVVKRGDADRASLRTGADRWWDCDAIDQNTLMGARVIRGTSGNRPAETAGERLAWLLGTSFTIFVDNGHVTYPTDPLDPNDYTLQSAIDVINDCATPGGYNFFALQVDDTDFPELFFMLPTSSDWASSVSISDDPADWDNATVFAPNYAAELLISDELIAEGVAVPYQGTGDNPYVYVDDSAIGDEFAYVDRVAPMANVKTSAKATPIAERHLDLSRTEAEKITCFIDVPPEYANAIRPWHRVPYMEQQPNTDGSDGYRIHLELSPVDDADPASCSVALAAHESATDEGLETVPTASVSLTAPDDGYVFGILYAANGNTPNAENMGTPAGYTVLDSNADYGRATWYMGYKAVSAGSVGMSASWTPGFASSGVWQAALAYLPWSSMTIVQEDSVDLGAGGTDMEFASPPTAGNTIIMVAMTYHNTGGVPFTLGGLSGPSTGWTTLFDPGDIQNTNSGAHIAMWARCVEEGDGEDYGYSYAGVQPSQAFGYIVEIAT